MRIKRNLIQICLLGALACLNPLCSSAAADSLPNFDKRLEQAKVNQPAVVNAAKESAASLIRSRVQDVRIDNDEILGSPKFVASTREFLTGTNGSGGAVSAATAAAFPANDPHRGVKTFLTEHHALFGFGPEALSAAKVNKDYISTAGGFRTTIWQQQLDDIPVFEGIFKAHLTKRGELINVGSLFVPDLQDAADNIADPAKLEAAPPISVQQAIILAAENIGDTVSADQITALDEPQGAEQFQHFTAFPVLNSASARLAWLPLDSATVQLCWEINFVSRARDEGFQVLVDAQTGGVWIRRCFTEHISNAQYNVFTGDSPSPFSPGWSSPSTNQPPLISRTLVTLSALSPTASPNGWINDGDNTTAGNNVDAHLDWNNDDVADPGERPVGSPFRVFNYPLDLTQEPSSYTSAAVVNLFYWNNWMHDQLYALGFDEAAGNFQNERFGHGGYPGTAVQADAQDSWTLAAADTTRNNANFLALPDGTPPRMQMYIYSGPTPNRDASLDVTTMCHEYTHGLSQRLVGGGIGISALQTEGMGEGWSDFYAISLLSKTGDDPNGNYPYSSYSAYMLAGYDFRQNYYYGARRYPYTTDMSKNPLTFKDIDPAHASAHSGVPLNPLSGTVLQNAADEVHDMGEVWCVTLWEARARLIARLGAAAGNTQMLQLVTDGMKLTYANPDFLGARNAIMQADVVDTGGANLDDLWIAFAKRGMGFSAVSPFSSTTAGLAEAFDLPPISNYPFVAITDPTEESFHSSPPTVRGTADSSVVEVWIYLQRMSDKLYYNPANATWAAPAVPITASGVANWSVALPALADGLYLIAARSEDGANLSPWIYRYFTMDTTTPTLSISSPAEGGSFASPPTVTGGVLDHYYVQEVRMALERGADGALYDFANNAWGTSIFDFGHNVKLATVVFTNWTATLPALANGSYDVQVQAADRAANTTTWNVRHFLMYIPPPVVTFSPLSNAQTIFDFSNVGGTINEVCTVKFRIWQYGAGGADDYWNGSAWIANGNDPSVYLAATVTGGTWSPAGGVTLPTRGQTRYGPYLLRVVASDVAGNASTNEILVTRSATDTTPPLVTLDNIQNGDVIANPALPGLSGSAFDPEMGIYAVTVYLNRFTGSGVLNWNGSSWSATPAALTASYNAQTVAWQVNAALPSGANLPNAGYEVEVDAANNESPSGITHLIVSFSVDYHPVFVFNHGSQSGLTPNMSWSDPANWDVGSVPTPDARVIINDNNYSPDYAGLGSLPLYQLDMSGGTLTTSGMTIQKLNLSGGALNGGAITIAANGVFNWSGGTLGSGVNLNLPATASFNISGADAKTLAQNSTINTAGNTTWTGAGLINVGYGSVFNNTGSFVAQNDSQFYNNTGYTPLSVFVNNGSFTKMNSHGTTVFNIYAGGVAFNNNGTINIQTGDLILSGGGAGTNGICTAASGSHIDLTGGSFNWSGNSTISGAGVTRVNGATLIFGGGTTTNTGTFEVASGTAGGTNTFAGTGTFNWSGGSLNGTYQIPVGASLNISGSGVKNLAGRLTTAGTVLWTDSGNVSQDAGSAIINNGLFDVRNDAAFTFSSGYAPDPVFQNNGTFRKSIATGRTFFDGFNVFNNTGTVDVQSGMVSSSHQLILEAGSTVSGAGVLRIEAGIATMNGTTTLAPGGNVELRAGTLTGIGAFAGTGAFRWSGGSLTGTNSIGAAVTMLITNGAVWLQGGAVLNNGGTNIWDGPSTISADAGSRLNNSGLFEARNDAAFQFTSGISPSPVFNNTGTFRKTGGTNGSSGTVFTSFTTFNNTGLVEAQSGKITLSDGASSNATFKAAAGATIEFLSGIHSLDGNIAFTGGGTALASGATLKLTGTTCTLGTGTLFELASGRLSGTGTINGPGAFNWSGGTISGTLDVNASTPMYIHGSGVKNLAGRLTTAGTVLWTDSGNVSQDAGSAIINNGLFDVRNDAAFTFSSGISPSPVFQNNGTFRKSVATGRTFFDGFNVFNNTGTVDVQSGMVSSSHQLTLEAGSTVSGAGVLRIEAGIATMNGTTTLVPGGNVELRAGTLTGIGAFAGTGAFRWSGGALAGTNSIGATVTMFITNGPVWLQGSTFLTNAGTAIWDGPSTISADAGSRLNNSGLFEARTNAAFQFTSGISPSPVFNNTGTFRKTGGTAGSGGTVFTSFTTFNNTGTVDLRSGVLTLGGYTLSGSTRLNLVLGGVNPGTQFSQETFAGPAALGGILSVTLANGFLPTNGQSFAIVTYGSSTGQFATMQFPTLPAGSQWQLAYNANALVLQVVQGVPSTAFQSSSLTNRNFQFTLVGLTGSMCLIEASTNLLNWGPLLTNTPFNGSLNFVDPQTAQFPIRFYRATIFP